MTDENNRTKDIKLKWEEHYQTTPMEKLHWYTERPDPEVEDAIRKFCPPKGDVLDLGTGPGTMAIELTIAGYSVTATDISQSAIDMAKKRAGSLAGKIDFVVDDIRDTKLKIRFDFIHDRGCFHVFNETDRLLHIINVHKLLKENGILLLKTFSTKETKQDGPNRYDYESIKRLFSDRFEFLHHEETVYPSTLPVDPKAFFCVLKKKRAPVIE